MKLAFLLIMASAVLNAGAQDTLAVATVTDSKSSAYAGSAPLQRMRQDELRTSGVAMLHEALHGFAGVCVKDYGGIGGMKTVSIRSFGAQHTGVCYDGIALSDAQNGQVDIGRFNTDNLQYVSVESGGSDDIFRSARLNSYAGVLTMKSRRPDFENGPMNVSAKMSYGSFNTYNPYLRTEHRLGRDWSAVFSANYTDSKGEYPFVLKNGDVQEIQIRLNSAVRSLSSELGVCGSGSKGGDLSFRLSYYGSSRGLPGSVILYSQNPTEHLLDRNITASASYERRFSERLRMKSGLAYCNSWNRYTNTDIAYPRPLDDRYSQNEAAGSATLLWAPAAAWELSFAEDLTAGFLDSSLADCVHPARFSSYSAVAAKYAAGRFRVTGGTLLTASADLTREAASGPAAKGRLHLSPWLSASCLVSGITDLRLRASLKDSYRMPSFNDMYYPRVGGRDLRPEKAVQSNLGLVWEHVFYSAGRNGRQRCRGGEDCGPGQNCGCGECRGLGQNCGRCGRQSEAQRGCGEGQSETKRGCRCSHSTGFSADAYYNRVRDKIVARPTMFIWTMRNVGEVEMAGCDITASYSCTFAGSISLRVHGGYSFQYAVDITDPQSACYRNQIAYTPRHCGNASAVVQTPWVNLCYRVSAVGERYSLAQNLPAYRIEPYADHCLSVNGDVSFGRRHRWTLHWSAEAMNLAGNNYEIIKYYPMPGRNYRITIKITY